MTFPKGELATDFLIVIAVAQRAKTGQCDFQHLPVPRHSQRSPVGTKCLWMSYFLRGLLASPVAFRSRSSRGALFWYASWSFPRNKVADVAAVGQE